MTWRFWGGKALLLTLSLTVIHGALAQERQLTVQQFFEGYASLSQKQCAARGDLERKFRAQGKHREANATANGEIMICDCVPSQLDRLQKNLTSKERGTKVTEIQFSEQYASKVVAACSGESVRRTYNADSCVTDFSSKADPAAYCSCMKNEVDNFTDSEAMELGNQTADWAPIAANAQKAGKPLPDMPPLVKRMSDMNKFCTR